jgi:signal transduction histidine kinase
MNTSPATAPVDQLRLDHQFRLVVSLNAFAIACLLHSLGFLASLHAIYWLIGLYTVPYALTWICARHLGRGLTFIRYVLSLVDLAAITAVVVLTGGLESPFFYLYPVPYLVHSFQLEERLVAWDGFWSLLSYGGVIWAMRHEPSKHYVDLAIGQMAFLLVVIAAALFTVRRFHRKDDAAARLLRVERTMARFLEVINALPPALPDDEHHTIIWKELQSALRPFGVYARLWIANSDWKTLQGWGEHPQMSPGSPQHLPMSACPAFGTRQAFHGSKEAAACPSGHFRYAKQICVPILNETQCFGVLFVASDRQRPWFEEESHLFDVLAQSIAWALQRKSLFEKLQEKISELNFSFEVGTAALASFGGSTQSIEETTIHILDSVLSILKVDRASLMVWAPTVGRLQTQWVRGGDFKIESALQLGMGEGMAGWALQTGEPYWAEYAMGDPHYTPTAKPIQSLLCVPVFTMDHQPLGVINAVTVRRARAFTRREIDFLVGFGRQAALAIENATLHHKNRANIDQLNELNKLKSQFLSLVSHDLRGPLTGIRGFCEILRLMTLGPLTPGQLELVDQLERQVQLQVRMVDDLLDLARMEKGQLSIHPAPTDLVMLLREEVEKSQLEARERGITLSLNLNLPGPLGPIPMDADRIRQVLWNLVHNSLKFTPEEGRVVVRAGVQDEEVLIDVEDTGIGLAADDQHRVFDKFFQVSPGGSTSAQGLGLGLAICKEIVLAHQGHIRAQSPGLGLGTTITVSLPLSTPQRPSQSNSLAA